MVPRSHRLCSLIPSTADRLTSSPRAAGSGSMGAVLSGAGAGKTASWRIVTTEGRGMGTKGQLLPSWAGKSSTNSTHPVVIDVRVGWAVAILMLQAGAAEVGCFFYTAPHAPTGHDRVEVRPAAGRVRGRLLVLLPEAQPAGTLEQCHPGRAMAPAGRPSLPRRLHRLGP